MTSGSFVRVLAMMHFFGSTTCMHNVFLNERMWKKYAPSYVPFIVVSSDEHNIFKLYIILFLLIEIFLLLANLVKGVKQLYCNWIICHYDVIM